MYTRAGRTHTNKGRDIIKHTAPDISESARELATERDTLNHTYRIRCTLLSVCVISRCNLTSLFLFHKNLSAVAGSDDEGGILTYGPS